MAPKNEYGFVSTMDVIKRDTVVRSMVQSLENIEDALADAQFSKERAETTFRKLLTDLDIEPMPSWRNGPAI